MALAKVVHRGEPLPRAQKRYEVDGHELDNDQKRAVETIMRKQNVCLSGPAGTGKTAVVKAVQAACEAAGRRVVVAATTAAAARLFDGITCCSLLGAERGRDFISYRAGVSRETDVDTPAKARIQAQKLGVAKIDLIKGLSLFVLDEFSMVSSLMFEAIDTSFRVVRNDSSPFGGVQLVVTGDAFQLPPIADKVCYLSNEWEAVFRDAACFVELKTNHRASPCALARVFAWSCCLPESLTLSCSRLALGS